MVVLVYGNVNIAKSEQRVDRNLIFPDKKPGKPHQTRHKTPQNRAIKRQSNQQALVKKNGGDDNFRHFRQFIWLTQSPNRRANLGSSVWIAWPSPAVWDHLDKCPFPSPWALFFSCPRPERQPERGHRVD